MIVIHLFGQCAIRTPSTLMQSQSTKLFILTLYCAAHRGRRLSRATIAELLWPLADTPTRQQRLRTALSRLRRLGVPIRDDGRAGMRVWIDAADVVMADTFLHTEPPEQLRQRDLRVLPDLTPIGNEPLRDWLDDFRFATQRTLVDALERRMALAERHDEWPVANALADLLIGVDARHATAHDTALRLRAAIQRRALAPRTHYEPLATQLSTSRTTNERRRLGCIHVAPGSKPDMAPVQYALHRLARGTGSTLLLWGASEADRAAHAHAIHHVAAAARVPTVLGAATDTPFGFFSAIAQPLASLPGAAGCDPHRVEWIHALVAHGIAQTPVPVALHQLRAVRDAVLDLIDAVVDEQPIVLIVDKADALDDASATILDTVIDWTARRPIGVILTAAHPWDVTAGSRTRRRRGPLVAADQPRYWTARRKCGTSPSSDDSAIICENSSP